MQGLRGMEGQVAFRCWPLVGQKERRVREREGRVLSSLECQGKDWDFIPRVVDHERPRAGVDKHWNRKDRRGETGKEVPTVPPAPPGVPHSRLSKGLKSWVVTILHLFPSRHSTLMLTTSALVSV